MYLQRRDPALPGLIIASKVYQGNQTGCNEDIANILKANAEENYHSEFDRTALCTCTSMQLLTEWD